MQLKCRRIVPLGSLFMDIILSEDVPDLMESRGKISAFCSKIVDGRWNRIIHQHWIKVMELFDEVLNSWPARLLRDHKWERGDIVKLNRMSVKPLDIWRLRECFDNLDVDCFTCVLSMLVALESVERVHACLIRINSKEYGALADEIARELEKRESEKDGIHEIITNLRRGIRGRSSILDACKIKWEQSVDLDDIVRFCQPLHDFGKKGPRNPEKRTRGRRKNDETYDVGRVQQRCTAIITRKPNYKAPTYNQGKGPAKDLGRHSYWREAEGSKMRKSHSRKLLQKQQRVIEKLPRAEKEKRR